jgi:hypothetical protein
VKKFEEYIKESVEDKKGKVINIKTFSSTPLTNSIKGYKVYYLDTKNIELKELLIDEKGYPYYNIEKKVVNRYGRTINKGIVKVSLQNKDNPYGLIYLIPENKFEEIKPLVDKISKIIKKLEEQKETLIELIGSKITH